MREGLLNQLTVKSYHDYLPISDIRERERVTKMSEGEGYGIWIAADKGDLDRVKELVDQARTSWIASRNLTFLVCPSEGGGSNH